MDARNIDDEQVLHVGGAQLAVSESIGQVSRSSHLLRRDPAAQHGRADIAIASLLLRVNPYVIAVCVTRRLLVDAGIESESDTTLQLVLEIVGCPAMTQKEELESGA